MNGLVSVVMPTYNRAHCIAASITSVLAQTYSNLELIVVDDGSKDRTAEVMAGIKDSRLRYLPQPRNAGRNAVRNVGVRAVTGEFVAFLDSDDFWLPDKLERQVAALQAAPEAALHIGAVLFVGATTARISIVEAENYDQPVWARDLGRDLNFPFITQNWLIRRSVLEEAGPFDEHIPAWEEHDLLARFCPRYPIITSRRPCAVVLQGPGSVTSNISGFTPEVHEHFLKRYVGYYGPQPVNVARATALTGWSNVRHGNFGWGRKLLWQSLMIYPWMPRTWANALLSLSGQTFYRRLIGGFKQRSGWHF